MANKHFNVTLKYVMFVFVVFVSTAFVSALITGILIWANIFNPFHGRNPFPVLLGFIFGNAVVGMTLALFMSRNTLRQTNEIINAINAIGGGDFNVEIKDLDEKPPYLISLSESINSMAKQLSSLEIMKTSFINDFSHDFKTPMSAILGYSQRLKSAKLTAKEQKEYIDIIIEESKRLLNMANNTLQISKLESTHTNFDIRPFRLDEQIRNSIIILEESWSNKRIHMHVNLDKITYIGNEDLLKQVWINLLENAIKYSNLKASINVSLTKADNKVIAIISDSGIGISEENIKRVFDKFYQVDNARFEKGSGLGLSIVKRIVELHDGQIELTSKLDQGSTFKITLPIDVI